MKKTVLHAAIIAFIVPMSLNAIGLGEMTVKSALGQPFLAEIELLDIDSSPIVGIKVGVADPENFQQIGLERIAALSLLNFNIEKNAKGKFVIKVRSTERMTEPYMELVVDLTWPHGQLYKAYTVLLDPPGYQLVSTRAQSSPTYYKKATSYKAEPGVIEKTVITEVQHHPDSKTVSKKQTTYGPTITNENVWQIAQRYKTSEIILPQIVLAIVGANPDAFKKGNLNGLKVGVRLVIPATQEIAQVPAELATAEVMAHDKAWNEKTPINHVLPPPYMNGQTINPVPRIITSSQINSSEVPAIPKFTLQSLTPNPTTMPQLITTTQPDSVTKNNQQPVQNINSQNLDQNSTIKAELSITAAAVESVRESNTVLMEQLHLLQDQNKKLQMQLDKRDKEMESIQNQMKVMMKQRLAVASQANTSVSDNQSSNFWLLLLLLIVAAGAGGFAYWYFKLREKDDNEPYLSDKPKPVEPKPLLPKVEQGTVKPGEVSIPPVTPSHPESSQVNQKDIRSSEENRVESNKPTVTLHPMEIKSENDLTENKAAAKTDSSESIIKPVKKQPTKKKKEVIPEAKSNLESKVPFKEQKMIIPDQITTSDITKEDTAKKEIVKEDTAKKEIVKEDAAKKEIVKEDAAKKEIVKEDAAKKEIVKEDAAKDEITKDEEAKKDTVKDLEFMEFEPNLEKELNKDFVQNQSATDLTSKINETKSETNSNKNKKDEDSSQPELLEFESGLHQQILEKKEQKVTQQKEQGEDQDRSIDFVSSLSSDQTVKQENQLEDSKQENQKDLDHLVITPDNFTLDSETQESNLDKDTKIAYKTDDIDPTITEFFAEPEDEKTTEVTVTRDKPPSGATDSTSTDDSKTANPLKSKTALSTLLALAKTYIGMDDIESARVSLEEVLEFGSDSQKAEAQRLLDEIKDK